MRPFEISPEAELRRESVQRTLLELYEDEDWQSLLAHAELLNHLWCQQREISRWLAAEAAENLNAAVMAGAPKT
jgi:hypothetical protein